MSQTPAPGEPTTSRGHSSSTLVRSSVLMASGTLVSRALGLVRVLLLAAVLGLLDSPAGNAWSTANTLPNTVYILLAGGVLNVVLVPQLTRAMSREDRGRAFTDRLITLALLGLVLITVAFTAGAALLTQFYALEWSGEQLALAVAFAYLCLPQIFFYGVYTVLGQVLNAQERFGWYMWAPVANNVVAIAGILVFTARYPDASALGPGDWTSPMVWLLGGTATLGVVAQAAVLVVPVHRSGFRYRPRFGFRGVGLGVASRMALWMLGVIGVSQAGMWLAINVLNRATVLDPEAPGKLAHENAFLFFILPHSLIATSLITAMFTQMSRSAHANDLQALSAQYRHGLSLLGVAMVPVSVAMLLLTPSLTATLLFGNSAEETRATAYVTMAFVVGLAPYAVYILSGRIFHAFQDGRTPFTMQLLITAVSVAGVLVAAALPPQVTAIGVALAQTLGQTAAAVLGVVLVRRRLGRLPLGEVRTTYLRVLAASLVMAVPTWLVVAGAETWLGGRTAAVTGLALGGPLYVLGYAALAHRLGVREVGEVAAPLLRRLRPGRAGRGATPPIPDTSGLGLAPRDPEDRGGSARTGPDGAGTQPGQAREEHGVEGIEPGMALGGRYVLDELLARRGDTLDYWSAHDSTLDRLVAVTLLPAEGEHQEMAEAVLDGARRTAGVDDPRLVRVLDVGLEDGLCWIVEEGLVDAESLASLVADHPLPAEEARRLVGEAATGLESARRRGLHHLFLSPHAVLRTPDGGIKVSGVAVAAALEQTEEIAPGEASLIDTSDLVGLLYTGLTGRWPGEEMEGLRTARRLADGSLPAPSEVVAGVPGDLDALCRMTLGPDYDPRRGPQTPGELAQQLGPWASDPVLDGGAPRPDAPLGEPAAGAAALGGAAGAAAASSAHADPAREPAGGTDPYYRTDREPDPVPPEEAEDVPTAAAASGAGAGASPAQPSSRPAQRRTTGVVIGVVLAIVAVAVFLAYGAIRGLGGADPQDQVAGDGGPGTATAGPGDDAESTGDAAGADGDGDEDDAQPEPGEPLQLAGITSYDPQGDGDERNDLVDRAIDGDPETAWNSHTYLSPGWGNLKDGVGLVVDLGESSEVREVDVTFPQGDYGAEVFVASDPSPEDAQSLGADDEASGTWTVTADDPVTGRYVVVYFDRAWTGPEGEIVYVSDITVR